MVHLFIGRCPNIFGVSPSKNDLEHWKNICKSWAQLPKTLITSINASSFIYATLFFFLKKKNFFKSSDIL